MDLIDKVNKLKNQHLKIALDSLLREVESVGGAATLDHIFKLISDSLQELGINSVFSSLDANKKNLLIKYSNFSADYAPLFFLNQLHKISFERLYNYQQAEEGQVSIFCKNRVSGLIKILPEYTDLLSGLEEVNSVIMPLAMKGEIVAFLEVFSARLQKNDLGLFHSFSKKLILRIANSILFYEVKRSEEKYKNLFEKAQDGFLIMNGRLRKFMNVNKKMCEISGYTKEEMLQMNYITLFAVEERKKIEKIVRQRLEEGEVSDKVPNNYESKIATKNGEIRYVQVSVIQYINHEEWFTIVRDVTNAKKTEEALLESESRYESIFESTGSANIIFDLDTIVLMINSEFEKLTGYSKKEIVGRKWTDFVPSSFLKQVREYQELVRFGKLEKFPDLEFSLRKKDGKRRDVIAKLGIIPGAEARIASLLDITERKQMERKIKESESRYRKLIEDANEAIVVFNPKGNINFANKIFYRISGYRKNDLPELHLSRVVFPEDLDKTVRRLNRIFNGEKSSDTMDLRIITKGNRIRFVNLSASKVLYNKKVIGVQAVVHDITENTELQNKVRRQLDYEKLIADISYQSLRARSVDSFMQKALRSVGEKIGVDRVSVLNFENRKSGSPLVYEWRRDIELPDSPLASFSEQGASWLTEYIKKHKILKYQKGRVLVGGQEGVKFLPVDDVSIMILPILTSEGLFGYICGESCVEPIEWNEEQERLMRVVGNIFAQTLDISILQDRIIKSKEHYKHVIDTIHDGICVVNRNFEIENFNRSFLEKSGLTAQQIKNKNFKNVIAAYASGSFKSGSLVVDDEKKNYLLAAFAGAGAFSFVEENIGSKKKLFYHRINIYPSKTHDGSINKVVISICDITEQKIAAEELRRLSEFNKRILDNVPVSIITLDKSGHVTSVNKFADSITNASELSGRSIFDLEFVKRSELKSKYRALLRDGVTFSKSNCGTAGKNKKSIAYLNITAVPLWDDNNKVEGAISMALDNTDAIETKEKIERLNEDLEKKVIQRTWQLNEANKELNKVLGLKSKFISDASHELRTPLTIIQGNLDLAIHETQSSDEEIPELYAVIHKEVKRMSGILSDLTMLTNADANTETFEFEPVYVSMLVADVIKSLSVLSRQKNIKLKQKGTIPKNLFVNGDESKLEKLLVNLVRNAIKYTERNGSVDISVEQSAGEIRMIVADDGIGIPRDDLPYIFERFYRVDKARSRKEGGTGLGLSICTWIAEAHGGHITVTSEEDKGSTFTVHLPVDYKKNSIISTLL